MIRPIVLWPHPILRKVSEPVTDEEMGTEPVKALVKDLIDTVQAAPGAGLSAVQIGVLKRVLVTNVDNEVKVYVNPFITKRGEKEEMREGCLSIPGIFGNVNRSTSISFTAFDEKGQKFASTLQGFVAQAFQHEYDHLNGKLYVDYWDAGAKDRLRAHLKKQRGG